jgi:hypothetical protein
VAPLTVAGTAQAEHAGQLAAALRYEPCSPTYTDWLRYGVQPKNAKPGQRPGYCKGKAHRREYLGYAGRRVLVSRKWSGTTLADHRAVRKAWLLAALGTPAIDGPYAWEIVTRRTARRVALTPTEAASPARPAPVRPPACVRPR